MKSRCNFSFLAGFLFAFLIAYWPLRAAPLPAPAVTTDSTTLNGRFTPNGQTAAIVSACDEASLRAALSGGGTVTFACDGTITLSNTVSITLDTILDGTGHAITISGNDTVRVFEVQPAVGLTLINLIVSEGRAVGASGAAFQIGGDEQGGAIRVTKGSLSAISCLFSNNTASGGKGGNATGPGQPGAGGAGNGGAISVTMGRLSVSNCVFTSNTGLGGTGGDSAVVTLQFGGMGGASRGGAIYAGSSEVAIERSIFANNRSDPGAQGSGQFSGEVAETFGGGVYIQTGSATLSNCALRFNSARAGGGAIYNQAGSVALSACVLEANGVGPAQIARGGGVCSASNHLGIVACLFTNNAATGTPGYMLRSNFRDGGSAKGGAICVDTGTFGVTNSAFAVNRAQGGDGFFGAIFGSARAGGASGGAIFNAGQGSVLNATFALNAARAGQAVFPDQSGGTGGALANVGGNLDLLSSTVASNTVSDTYTNNSRGAGCYDSNGSFTLRNTILAGNVIILNTNNNAFGPITDGGHNLSSDASGPFSGPGSLNNIEPKLGPLADNGGPTPTMTLLWGSPAIDAADNQSCPATDQRGVVRPQSGGCDVGAFELTHLSIQPLPSGNLHLEYRGVPNQAYTLQRSSNLADWSTIETALAGTGGIVVFQEINPTGLSKEFFRITPPTP